MADSYGGGNAVQRWCRIESDGVRKGSSCYGGDHCRPNGSSADRDERPCWQNDTTCRYGDRSGSLEARIPHCQSECQAVAQEALTLHMAHLVSRASKPVS